MLRESNRALQAFLISIACSMLIQTGYALERYKRGETVDSGISYTIGLEYEQGDYGTGDTTDVWRIPFGADYRNGQFLAGLYIPYLMVEGEGNITISTVRMRTIVRSSSSDESGIGDLRLYAGYLFPAKAIPDATYHAIGYIKVPTADEDKGLGTGEYDYALEGGMLFKYQRAYIYTNLGYELTGDTASIDYDNVFYASVSATFPQENRHQLGVELAFAQAATPGYDDALELTGFMNVPLEKKRSLYLYVMLGLTDGSPDVGVGGDYRFE